MNVNRVDKGAREGEARFSQGKSSTFTSFADYTEQNVWYSGFKVLRQSMERFTAKELKEKPKF